LLGDQGPTGKKTGGLKYGLETERNRVSSKWCKTTYKNLLEKRTEGSRSCRTDSRLRDGDFKGLAHKAFMYIVQKFCEDNGRLIKRGA